MPGRHEGCRDGLGGQTGKTTLEGALPTCTNPLLLGLVDGRVLKGGWIVCEEGCLKSQRPAM